MQMQIHIGLNLMCNLSTSEIEIDHKWSISIETFGFEKYSQSLKKRFEALDIFKGVAEKEKIAFAQAERIITPESMNLL